MKADKKIPSCWWEPNPLLHYMCSALLLRYCGGHPLINFLGYVHKVSPGSVSHHYPWPWWQMNILSNAVVA